MGFDKAINKYVGWIYKITNTQNDKIYIGQTMVSVEHRWSQHINAAKRADVWEGLIYKAMRKYDISNFSIHKIFEIKCDTKKELIDKLNFFEKQYISKLNTVVPNGYNLTKGGENTSIKLYVPVDAYYANGTLYKSFDSIVDAYNDVKSIYNADNGSSLISKCCKGELQYAYGFIWRNKGDGFNKYILNATQEEIDRYHGHIKVLQYNNNGNLLNTYDSILEAYHSLNKTGINTTAINMCCNGKRKTAYGYVWRYNGDTFDKYNSESLNTRRIKQYSLDGVLIKIYNSISEACKKNKISNHSNIISCCIGKKYSANGFVWRYYENEFNTYKTPDNKEPCGRKFKKINQYRYDEFIKTFNKSIDAANEIKCLQTSITTACNRHGGGCNGYKWFYANDPDQPDKTKIIS